MEFAEKIRKEILSWEGVEEKQNRFGTKMAYFLKNKEFCHFHSNAQMDILKSEDLRDLEKRNFSKILKSGKTVKNDNRMLQNPYSSNWVLFNFKTEEDASIAIKLCKSAYNEARGK